MNPNYRTQGKCPHCQVRHTWPERLQRFAGSKCPHCNHTLKRTSRSSTLPVHDWPEGLGVEPAQQRKTVMSSHIEALAALERDGF